MTGVAFLALVLTGAFAVGDWIAVAHENKRLESLCKPLTMVCLIAVALALDVHDPAVRAWFIVALIFSLAGDVFLMLERDLFVVGLASFLIAHLAYIGGMVTDGVHPLGLVVGVVFVAVSVMVLGTRIVGATRASEPELVMPVAAYMVVISAMVVAALGVGRPLGIVGAGLFYASDAMIGWNRFVRASPALPLAIVVTYHLGQVGLVLSLV